METQVAITEDVQDLSRQVELHSSQDKPLLHPQRMMGKIATSQLVCIRYVLVPLEFEEGYVCGALTLLENVWLLLNEQHKLFTIIHKQIHRLFFTSSF